PDLFNTCAAFYIKKMMTHLTNKDNKSVIACRKAIEEILTAVTDPSTRYKTMRGLGPKTEKIVAGFAATVQDKSPTVRKHSFVFLKSVLERHGGGTKLGLKQSNTSHVGAEDDEDDTKSEKDSVKSGDGDNRNGDDMDDTKSTGSNASSISASKETLDLITEAVRIGLKDKDKLVRTEAMECANLLSGIDESRFEGLLSGMPAQFRKTYHQKYGGGPPVADDSIKGATGSKSIYYSHFLYLCIFVMCFERPIIFFFFVTNVNAHKCSVWDWFVRPFIPQTNIVRKPGNQKDVRPASARPASGRERPSGKQDKPSVRPTQSTSGSRSVAVTKSEQKKLDRTTSATV
ncbi:hypothetical protein RFI_25930, partial [Reticulomyxa filosa]